MQALFKEVRTFLEKVKVTYDAFWLAPSLVSGLLYGTAFYVPYAWPVIFFALVPVFLSVVREKRFARAWWKVFVCFLISMGFANAWILYTLPYAGMPASLLPFFTLTLTLSWAVFTTSAFALVQTCFVFPLRKFGSTHARFIPLLGLLFVFLEYVRMYAFKFITINVEVANPAWYSFGFVGYPLADSSSWLQFVSWGGIYTLSFIAITVNLVFVYLLSKMQGRWKQTLVIFFAGFLVLVSVTPIASIREALHGPSTNTVEVGIMSLWSGSDGRLKEESAYESELASLVQSLDAEGADFILLPEGGEYKGAPTKTLHVYSEPYRPKGSKPYSGIFAGYERHPREEYLLRTKIALAPQGEYPVWVYSGPFELLGLNEISSSLTGGAGFITGTLGKPLALGTTSVSLMFCLEIFMPSLGAKLVQVQGTDLLAVAISYASFSRPYTLDTDARRALRIQAVHAGVPLVSSADYTSAYAFDRYGNELARIGGERESEYRVVSLPL